MGLKETEWEGMDWITLAQDEKPGANAYDSGNEPACAIYCGNKPVHTKIYEFITL